MLCLPLSPFASPWSHLCQNSILTMNKQAPLIKMHRTYVCTVCPETTITSVDPSNKFGPPFVIFSGKREVTHWSYITTKFPTPYTLSFHCYCCILRCSNAFPAFFHTVFTVTTCCYETSWWRCAEQEAQSSFGTLTPKCKAKKSEIIELHRAPLDYGSLVKHMFTRTCGKTHFSRKPILMHVL